MIKKSVFILPLLLSSCVTSDYIHIAASATMFTVATQVEGWYLKHEAKMDSIRPIREARRDSIRAPKIAKRDSIREIKTARKDSIKQAKLDKKNGS